MTLCLEAAYKVGFSMAFSGRSIAPTHRCEPQIHVASYRDGVIFWHMSFKISVLVRPRAKQESVTRVAEGSYRVAVHAPAQEGKANRALIGLLAQHFSVPKSAIRIVRGHAARQKIIEIEAESPTLG